MWLGNNSWLIHFQNILLATDIDLASSYRINKAPISAEDIAPHLNVHLITHAHGDHFNESMNKIFHEQGSCLFVIPQSCEETARMWGIGKERIKIARPGENFSIAEIKVQAIRALHGDADSAVAEFANFSDCGYVFEINGRRFLQPGDTVLLADHLIRK